MAKQELATLDNVNPVAVIQDGKAYSDFYAKVKAECDAFKPDVTTLKGRGEIASMAYKVTRTKTTLDDAGKKLNEEARTKINAVDAQRRKIREEFDALVADVRKPLTEWEAAEDARTAEVARVLARIANVEFMARGEETSDALADWLAVLNDLPLDPDVFLDGMEDAVARKAAALETVNTLHARTLKAEADAEELAKLRAAEAERQERERLEREAKAAAELAEREAKEKAEREVKAEADRIERERKAAEEAKQREADAAERAREDEAAKARKVIADAEAKATAEREALQKAIADGEAERDKIKADAARKEQDRLDAEQKSAFEQARRDADKKHRGEVMKAAKEALMEAAGITEDQARAVVRSIVSLEIPNVTLKF